MLLAPLDVVLRSGAFPLIVALALCPPGADKQEGEEDEGGGGGGVLEAGALSVEVCNTISPLELNNAPSQLKIYFQNK